MPPTREASVTRYQRGARVVLLKASSMRGKRVDGSFGAGEAAACSEAIVEYL